MLGKEVFNHGRFWDHYSKGWESKVGQHLAGQDHAVLGTEWGDDEEARFVLEKFAEPYVQPGSHVVEIGPGGGKFSRRLVRMTDHLTLADVSAEMLRRASRACDGSVETIVLDGQSLQPIADASVDFVFSHDVFVHFETEELFRYFAEVNRILKPDGIFAVNTNTLESRYGFLTWTRLLRYNLQNIGQRYGGRTYPLCRQMLLRLADASGFTVVEGQGDWEESAIMFALRKDGLACVWSFCAHPELYQAYEVCDRAGGSGRRQLLSMVHQESGELHIVLVGESSDPYVQASAQGEHLPNHPSLPTPLGCETRKGLALVRFEHAHGPSLGRLLREPVETIGAVPFDLRMLSQLLEGAHAAFAAGLVHGELTEDAILLDIERRLPLLFGMVEPEAAGIKDIEGMRQTDVDDLSRILRRVAGRFGIPGEVGDLAGTLAAEPSLVGYDELIKLLAK